ncbi:phosphate ABC transporter substrate-binding protein PstS [Rhodanobacter sp. 7MK24]|uniref:phosphate ABC transporter substrate-binding protein PstS n=1 Tax=Rhodanobacter sp. 7MK24 TaxID=2775922 RepID=UPI001782C736|nr:phosphate ABC transporter substrate-binding protein PstS [Rhodanobacter sp. 7MK24]MBD8882227.1 phosphate ABC transporter substrate-binding protein PstS [Rhodanobacter sp. 7MK24]
MFRLGAIAFAAACALGSLSAQATDITGAGSSFVYPVISKWSAAYAEKTGNRVNYQSIGSGGGIAQIKAGTVDFGASDMPLDEATLGQFGLAQFPDVIGGIVPAFNVTGVAPGKLVLDGKTLAGIFLGTVAKWNDPAIAALNPGVKLPDAKITVVHRSDGSGTTFNFSDYLSKVDATWKAKVGEGTAVNWPTGIGGKGNEGVSAYIRQIPNSIGYVEYAYALKNNIGYAVMKNAAGKVVQPNTASFQAAAATADWASAKNFNLLMTNAPGAGAWPITATSWVIVYKQPKNAANGKVILDFFKWSYENGQDAARSLDYVPLPTNLVGQIENYWKTEIKQ